jgi:hypothetical protein
MRRGSAPRAAHAACFTRKWRMSAIEREYAPRMGRGRCDGQVSSQDRFKEVRQEAQEKRQAKKHKQENRKAATR